MFIVKFVCVEEIFKNKKTIFIVLTSQYSVRKLGMFFDVFSCKLSRYLFVY